MKNKDELIIILKEHLKKNDKPDQTADELIFNVVAEYMAYLMSIGNIPSFLLDTIEADLKEESKIIYQKITYGFSSLKDYRNGHKTKRSRSI